MLTSAARADIIGHRRKICLIRGLPHSGQSLFTEVQVAAGKKKGKKKTGRVKKAEAETPAAPAGRKNSSKFIIVFLLVVILPGISYIYFSREKASSGNILLITLDTVRADRLHCYDYETISTPNIDHLAAGGVQFENAIAPAPMTLPSHVSLLTGLYPLVHGVHDNSMYRLSDRAITLAEIMRDNGYRTGAVVGAFVLDSSYGLDQGFGYYDDEFPDPALHSMITVTSDEGNRVRMKKVNERDAASVTEKAINWLDTNSEHAFFLWVHYYDAHFPYLPPAPFSTRYGGDAYAGEIASIDQQLGFILDELRAKGLIDKTLIVLVGDHGEAVGEHEETTHGIFIYESSVRVPLILHYPGRLPPGKKISATVSLVDVVPTILDLLDIHSGTDFGGLSLTHILENDTNEERFVFCESMFPYLNYGWSKIFGLRSDRWKYIKTPHPELYDISQDPHELNNLIQQESTVAVKLDSILVRMISKTSDDEANLAESARLSDEDRDRLLALGYITGVPAARGTASLRDPKEMIRYHRLITDGERAMQEGLTDSALTIFDEIVKADSTNAYVHNMMGTIRYQMKDIAGAREEFQKAIEYNPDIAVAYQNLGNIHYHNREFQEAASYYEKAVELDPNEQEYYIGLAGIYEILGDNVKAEGTYRKAIDRGYTTPRLLLTYGKTLVRLGRFEEARESFEEAVRDEPRFSLAYNELGNLMDKTGKPSEAVSMYTKAITINPALTAPRYNLARILLRSGKKDEAISELLATVRINPLHTGAHYLLGELYFEKGDAANAKVHYHRFLELETKNETARRQVEARLSGLKLEE